MPTLTVIAGPNGSGKSTLMRSLNFEGRQNLLNPDDIAVELSPANPEKAAFAAGRQVLERTREYLQTGVSFAIETTLSSKQNLATLRAARDAGFQIRLIYVALDNPEKNLFRVKERVASGMRLSCTTIPACGIRKFWKFATALLPGARTRCRSGHRKSTKH